MVVAEAAITGVTTEDKAAIKKGSSLYCNPIFENYFLMIILDVETSIFVL